MTGCRSCCVVLVSGHSSCPVLPRVGLYLYVALTIAMKIPDPAASSVAFAASSPWWKSRRSTETGEAPRSQGATTENIQQYLMEEQRSERGCIAGRMPPGLPPRTVEPSAQRPRGYYEGAAKWNATRRRIADYRPGKNDGRRTSRIVRKPGPAVIATGIEFTAIEAVAMSPWMPPSTFE